MSIEKRRRGRVEEVSDTANLSPIHATDAAHTATDSLIAALFV